MAWLCSDADRVCSAMYGSEELLMFMGSTNCDRLITNFDHKKRTFGWVSLNECCTALSLSVSQFLDCCILVGFEESVMPTLDMSDGEKFNQLPADIQAIAPDLEKLTGPILLESNSTDEKYLDQLLVQFLRIKNFILHHVVLTSECLAVMLSSHNIDKSGLQTSPRIVNNIQPHNLHQVHGPRLPNLVYYFLSMGLISSSVISNVVHNRMMEYLPDIDSIEYRELLQKIVPLRTQIAYLLINCMMRKDNEYWKVHHHGGGRAIMTYVQWYNEKVISLHTPPELLLDDWELTQIDIETQMPQQGALNFCTVLPFSNRALKSSQTHAIVHTPGPVPTYSHPDEIMCVILLKSLDLLGYFTHPPHQKPNGTDESGTSLFAEALRMVDWNFAEHCVLFIELLRTGALHCQPFITPESPVITAPITNVTFDSSTLLISRVLSIVPMRLAQREWGSNVLVRDLCAFNVLFRSLYRTLRNLTEVIMLVLFLDGRVNMSQEHDNQLFENLVQRLPFSNSINMAMGIVIHYLLMNHERAKGNTPMERWNSLRMEETFPCCLDIRNDLERANHFWRQASQVVSRLESGNAIAGRLCSEFAEASTLLTTVMSKFF
eukprot:NODE_161_length_2329_cov_77.548246_g139_i0.p1 GENE.NODE_161_length_2329_cov_77.548246_g139_i0~~NODE_161_length_2329_cov_77.548246_g139_i0.p1  ORF type:complete len:604 (-),score=190.40 NODE_161_length_2329_cov_77.548246_g139_i0:236-2047(-)